MPPPHAVITGASAGIGAAITNSLTAEGYRLSLGARRVDRLAGLGGESTYRNRLDVTEPASITEFLAGARAAHGPIDVLINNAGKAKGLAPVAEGEPEHWREMMETNVMGVLQVCREVLPEMIERGSGHVVMLGSIAGHDTYEKGTVYCATKYALRSITTGIRYEVLGTGVRVTSIDPGLVETEFSLVRFDGDAPRAAQAYADTRPLTAADVAECVLFALRQPPHVNIDTLIVKPTDQAGVTRIVRR